MSIEDRILIARLAVSQWYPRKYDRKASEEIAKLHGIKSADDAGRYNKILVDLETIKPLQQAITKLRTKHYELTTPAGDDGDRLLPVELFYKYTEELRSRKEEIDRLTRKFVHEDYATEREKAKERLNGLFNASDYPEPDEVENRFQVSWRFKPLPSPEKCEKLGIFHEDADAIEAQVRQDVEETLKKGHDHIIEQLSQRTREFVARVKKFNSGESKKLYEASLENLRDIADLVINGYSILPDRHLTNAAVELYRAIDSLDIDQLRHSEGTRVKKLAEVEAIANKFRGVI